MTTLDKSDLHPSRWPLPLSTFVGRETEVGPPVLVMSHQLVLVERTVARPRLRHERILDSGGPQKVGCTAC